MAPGSTSTSTSRRLISVLEPYQSSRCCPHVGSASQYTRNKMGQLTVDNLLAYKAGKPPLTPTPDTPLRSW